MVNVVEECLFTTVSQDSLCSSSLWHTYIWQPGNSAAYVQDFFAESVTTRVVIPEGSSDVQVDLGRLTASITDDRSFTYLDTMIGRPTKIIQVPPVHLRLSGLKHRPIYSRPLVGPSQYTSTLMRPDVHK